MPIPPNPETSKAKVLLTGCCGYIGSWVAVELLRAGYRVRGTTQKLEDTERFFDDVLAGEQDLRGLLGAFMFSGAQLDQPAGTLSGGEKTRLALAGLVASKANVLLLDEPTNNLDPASREQVLDALRSYQGAVVLVTHDPGAAEALDPQRVVLLPDGTEDFWSDDYRDLIELA